MKLFGPSSRRVLIAGCAAVMLGCQMAGVGPEIYKQPLPERPGGVWGTEPDLRKDLTIYGKVAFPESRRTQATEAQILGRSTVSLIDLTTGATLGTGLTNDSGIFALNPVGSEIKDNTYFLVEATKGLAGQLPGRDAPRMRTIIHRGGSFWHSITNSANAGDIVINAMTTAVAIEHGLDPTGVPLSKTIGKVFPGPPAILNSSPSFPSHPDAEILKLSADILAYLTNDFDPVGTVGAIKPQITGVNPPSGGVLGTVAIDGRGFHPVALSDMVVTFGGVQANILMASQNKLIVAVPGGVPNGNVAVVVSTSRGGNSGAFTFTVTGGSALAINAISPNPAMTGQFVTLVGSGFSTTPGNNQVSFNGQNATPVEATATTLRVAVPAGATTGTVRVTVSGSQTNGFALVVGSAPIVSSFFPDRGTVKSEIRIKGLGFGRRGLGQVLIDGKDANVIAWTDSLIRVEVPWNVKLKANSNFETTAGSVAIQVLSNSGAIASGTWQALAGEIASGGQFANIDSTQGPNGAGTQAWLAGERIMVHGGNGWNNRAFSVGVNSDGSLKGDWREEVGAPSEIRIDDNPKMTALVGAKRWIMASNGNSRMFFAKLDPISGSFLGWGENPANYLPSGWIGKDHIMSVYGWTGIPQADGRGGRAKKAYVYGAGVSCGGCAANGFGMIYADVTEDDNLGPWITGPDLIRNFGEDAWPVVTGNTLYAIGGTDGNARAQFIQVNDEGIPDPRGWRDSTGNAQRVGSMLSNDPQRVGNWVYTFDTWCDTRCSRSGVVLDTYLAGFNSHGNGPTSNCGHTDVAVGRFYYMFGGNGSSRVYQAVIS